MLFASIQRSDGDANRGVALTAKYVRQGARLRTRFPLCSDAHVSAVSLTAGETSASPHSQYLYPATAGAAFWSAGAEVYITNLRPGDTTACLIARFLAFEKPPALRVVVDALRHDLRADRDRHGGLRLQVAGENGAAMGYRLEKVRLQGTPPSGRRKGTGNISVS